MSQFHSFDVSSVIGSVCGCADRVHGVSPRRFEFTSLLFALLSVESSEASHFVSFKIPSSSFQLRVEQLRPECFSVGFPSRAGRLFYLLCCLRRASVRAYAAEGVSRL